MSDEVLKVVLNNKSFGRNEAASIVGGLNRLNDLIGKGLIRYEKKCHKQNGKWYCNAYDVIKYATLK